VSDHQPQPPGHPDAARLAGERDRARKAWRWPAIVIGTLVATVLANVVVIVVAQDDGSLSVDPDYYRKAVNWDADQARARRGARLGWQLELAASRIGPDGVVLTPRVRAADGSPLAGATVRVTARHVAHANEPFTATAVPDGDAYVARLPLRRAGLWDVAVEVLRQGNRVEETRRVELFADTPAATASVTRDAATAPAPPAATAPPIVPAAQRGG
jgi:hypothetical protein